LAKKGVDFEILEASDHYGGRLGELNGFASYPLDLGAQWLHGKKSIAGDLWSAAQELVSPSTIQKPVIITTD
jgi:monoamine oxidase